MNLHHAFEKDNEKQVVDNEKKNIDNGNESITEDAAADKNAENETSEQSADEKMADLENKYLRLAAEFDNYRKRTARERLEFMMTAGEDLICGLLPVIDDFERAIKAIDETDDAKAIREGVELIYNKLFKYLESCGLKKIDAVGKALNTDEHEAVTKFPAPAADQKGKVIDVIQHGYTLNGKIIRYAKVVVGE
ncbi:MAG: nucleotide exchange factor GrpE [Prevotellaceae bacterium]|jgi:molecular chaperone GrpE|nr:nucleotide exchange factor GrpE [Prevotellaceae bacterium]